MGNYKYSLRAKSNNFKAKINDKKITIGVMTLHSRAWDNEPLTYREQTLAENNKAQYFILLLKRDDDKENEIVYEREDNQITQSEGDTFPQSIGWLKNGEIVTENHQTVKSGSIGGISYDSYTEFINKPTTYFYQGKAVA